MNELQMHDTFNLVLLTSIITHIYLKGETIVKGFTMYFESGTLLLSVLNYNRNQ